MEIYDAMQQMELIYRAGLFFGVILITMVTCRDSINRFFGLFDGGVQRVLDTVAGVLVAFSILVVVAAFIRFGVQFVLGV